MRRFIATMIAAISLFAGECTYRVMDFEIGWEAYKTPAKIGVDGTFGNIKLSAMPDKTVKGLLEGAKVVIDTGSVNSKNSSRDAKLIKAFFNVQGVHTIAAEIKSLGKSFANVDITMNGITKTVPMKLEFDGDDVEAEGYIDLADFEMLPSLRSINKACYDLHKGKTWQDIRLQFEIKTMEKCK
ncbi:YceI family protein [Hydrogenimonas urashimensis]|uniref:YceI family protein n=1 Tax=Hydrogenimonas urashimensis TaxID=2740515 RepID=UPI0019156DA7|nr:YceI family protein [Hydrogenimonas urashimensis]